MKKLLCYCLMVSAVMSAQAQDKSAWTAVSEASLNKNIFANRYKPSAYQLFKLDETGFGNALYARSASTYFTVTIPNAAGMPERYKVVSHSVMDPALAARYPQIRSFMGQGIDDPAATVYFDYSPGGFHGMILHASKPTVYLDPVDRESQSYVVFARTDAGSQKKFTCLTRESVHASHIDMETGNMQRGADDGRLRTYRLALACTGEYAQYFLNGTETTDAQRKAKVLAAMNTLMVRTNGIYERDFGIHMNLISNNDAIIYLNASTDPWTTEWNTKTQQTIDAVIGSANYDIGHLVHKESSAANNNGNAGCIGCICVNGSKGSAFTSHVTPEGDPFVVDYTTHEMGHQFGANHTFTFSNESGTASQMEPGSGSTIMGYAGITGANTDVQPHSDDYFHTRSIDQVTTYIKGATGGGCAVVTITGNATPTVTATSYTIPRSTPFALTATGADANAGDVLTYTWEQINTGTSTSTIPSATRTTGPAFRSRNNGTNPTRTFPILASILDGTNTNKWEVLPSVARTLNFRVTVKDNHVGGGNNQTADATVTVSSASGPFAVSAPNTAVSWAGGSTQTITWSVASTTAAPVSCANVKISLSTDGGQTFPTVLIASTPNDGTQALTIPNTATTTARIKVEAVGNIFFDISNTNFTITAGTGCTAPTGLASAAIANTSATVSWGAVSGAVSYDVDYKAASSATWVNAATATTAVSVNLSSLTQGTLYDWRVRTNCASASSTYSSAQFTTTAPATCNAPTGLTASSISSTAATVSWAAVSGAVSYAVDYKASSSVTWISAATASTALSVSLTGLTASTVYDYRVRTNCSAANSSYVAAQFTTSAPPSGCTTAFEANETQATAASIAVNTPVSAAIGTATDIDYYKVTTTATSNFNVTLTNLPADYDLYLYNSAGTQIGSSTAGSTTSETIALSSQAAGTYYVRVIGYNGVFSTTVCYNLNVGSTIVTGCQSSYDNSTNGTTAGAATIPFNTNITGLVSPSADVDNYRFVITTGGTITVTLGTLPADYDVKLLNSAGTQVGISQNGGTSSETINYTAAAGTYFAQVYGYNGANSASTCYTLKVQLGTATRQDITPVASAKGGISVYPNPSSQFLKVALKQELARNSMISIIDAKGVVVMAAKYQLNPQTIDISTLTPGFYLLKINNGGTIITEKFIKQ